MDLNNLRVSDVQDLRAEATKFEEHATAVKKITDEMMQLVQSTIGCWGGKAQKTYTTQFEGLTNDMKVIYDMCQEYSTDLIEIAKNYETAEETNTNTASRLKADVNLIV